MSRDPALTAAPGALADPDSFERERAVYNALTDKIRNLLLSYDYTKAADPLQPWSSHITSLLVRQTPPTSDITLSAAAEDFALHKYILSARSPYFRRKFAEAPETAAWRLSPSIPVEAFRVVLRYLYLGDVGRDLVGSGSRVSEEDVFKGIDKLCKLLELDKLWEVVLSINDRRLARQRQQDEVHRAQAQLEAFFKDTVLRHKMVVDTHRAGDVKWPHHNTIFANCILRADEDPEEDDDEDEEEEEEDREREQEQEAENSGDGDADTGPAVGGSSIPVGPVEGAGGEARNGGGATGPAQRQQRRGRRGRRGRRRSVLFPAHKLFLIRSPYFETMFSSDFREAHDAEHLHVIKVDCSPAVLEILLRYLYTEKCDCPLEHALDLLYAADMLLLERLKTKAAVTISTLGSATRNVLVDRTHGGGGGGGGVNQPLPSKQRQRQQQDDEVEPINVYDVIRAAWDLKVQRLEEFAARYLAFRLEDYIDEEDFAELIRESASRLVERHETDTIELLDDIRYFLSERFRLRFEGEGLREMLTDAEERLMAASASASGGRGPEDKEEPGPTAGDGGGGVRTLNGEVVEDEFASDALNYRLLMEKIDKMLERLNLDA